MTCPVWRGEHLTMRSPAVSSALLTEVGADSGGAMLIVGDDWAENHHDAEIVDTARVLPPRYPGQTVDPAPATRGRPPARAIRSAIALALDSLNSSATVAGSESDNCLASTSVRALTSRKALTTSM